LQKVIKRYDFDTFFGRIGSMFSLFFHPGPIHNVEDVKKCNFELFSKYFHGLLNKGIYIAPSQYEAGFISLSHDEHILDFTISVIDEVLNELMVPVS
jgi:glutamate-1-semialdehyde 2,1-aminomutase